MNLKEYTEKYLHYCHDQKRLDNKTLKAYRIDLTQFTNFFPSTNASEITSESLESYISNLHKNYKPKTVKRKIASLKAFFHYLEYKEHIDRTPFNKLFNFPTSKTGVDA